MFLIVSVFASLPEVSQAQCPDSTMPDPGPAWSGPYTKVITIPGSLCQETITYCDRDRNGGLGPLNWEVYITSVTPVSGSICTGISPETMIQTAFDSISIGDSLDFDAPDCGHLNYQSVTTFRMGCWKFQYDPNRIPIFSACEGGNYCTMTCQVCRDPVTHKLIVHACTLTTVGDPNCPVAAPGLADWKEGVCYNLPCGPN
jgi:hypothetical protein